MSLLEKLKKRLNESLITVNPPPPAPVTGMKVMSREEAESILKSSGFPPGSLELVIKDGAVEGFKIIAPASPPPAKEGYKWKALTESDRWELRKKGLSNTCIVGIDRGIVEGSWTTYDILNATPEQLAQELSTFNHFAKKAGGFVKDDAASAREYEERLSREKTVRLTAQEKSKKAKLRLRELIRKDPLED